MSVAADVAEVLGKLPVAQHMLFGLTLNLPLTDNADVGAESAHPHAHTFGDCCGIPIPAAFGAARSKDSFRVPDAGVRRVPFD